MGHYNRFDVLSINVNDEKLTPMRRVYRKTELLEEERLLTYLSEEKLKLFIEKTRSEGKGLPEALEEMIDRYLDTGS
ncbi:MAG: hypothetical protein GTO54_03595 [Nitrososphaeria archaeon]|nr:hypothetical protein [Nitrososphaeria archaeon]